MPNLPFASKGPTMTSSEQYTPTWDEVRDAASPDGSTAIEYDALDRFIAGVKAEARAPLEAAIREALAFRSVLPAIATEPRRILEEALTPKPTNDSEGEQR